MGELREILSKAVDQGASDIHFVPGSPVRYRIDGELLEVSANKLLPNQIMDLMKEMKLAERDIEILEEHGEMDCAHSEREIGRFRVNIYKQRSYYAMVLRILAVEIPSPEMLGLPEAVINLADKKQGLVLVTGATGSGKSTTLAALIKRISERHNKNIITLEDPIEYLHSHNKSIIAQREVGTDTNSYSHALRAALRQDPDVILVGEMRDLETISIAITAAETGHLVFSTVHTNDSSSTIDRIIDVFPAYQQQQIRVQLSNVLECVLSQHLLPKKAGKGRIAAFEILLKNPAIQNLIRESKAFQIPSVIQTNRDKGMMLMDDALYQLYMENHISEESALGYAHDPKYMRRKLGVTI